MQQILDLYKEWKQTQPARIEEIAGAGSNRHYVRLADDEGHTVIGCQGTNAEENRAFLALARQLGSKGLPVPQVLAVSADQMCYLQTDLGSTSLFDLLKRGREAGGHYDAGEVELLRRTIRLLPHLQIEGAQGMDFSACFPQPAFDETGVMFDLNYFKYCFLKPMGVEFQELRLEEDFRLLARHLTEEDSATFLYRDFQARNVMVNGERIAFIDFQGGRRGPVYYDVASFLWQASARYPSELRQQLIGEYYEEACRLSAMPAREAFDQRLQLFVFFRLLQVLGAYGFRGCFERKKHFLDSIPPALESLRQVLESQELPYPTLTSTLQQLCRQQTTTEKRKNTTADHLTVRVTSFSFKRGIPADESGNGGGYVFDCRGTHNPGRYDEYKQLTGLDAPVMEFLENDGEILTFLEHVYALADAHVARYVERGFSSLMFSFGCTGGQHRSVYAAQHLADHLHSRFPQVEIRLCHREQHIEKTYCHTPQN